MMNLSLLTRYFISLMATKPTIALETRPAIITGHEYTIPAAIISGISSTQAPRIAGIERINEYVTRWETLKNFKNSPTEFNNIDAGCLLKNLFQ